MRRIITLILAAVIAVTALGGCGKKAADSDLKYIKDKGKLIVGITIYKPMDYKDDNGEWTGFDAEFARAAAEKLGVEAEFTVIEWDSRYFELDSKNIDVIWNGMTISDEVLRNCDCTDPYVKNAQVVVTDKQFAEQRADADSIKGLTLAVEAGSAGAEALDGIDKKDYTAVLDQATALMEVASGKADACVIDLTMANAVTGEGKGYPDLTISCELTGEEYGIGCRKGSDLTKKLNEIMKEMMKDGALDALAEKYELTLVKGE